MQFPDFPSVYGRGCRPTQPFPVLPRMRQARPGSFAENLSFKLGEYREQASHGATGWRGQIQRFGQGDETDSKMLQFTEVLPVGP